MITIDKKEFISVFYKIYFVGSHNVYCIDIRTQEILWDYQTNNFNLGSNYFIQDDLFVVREGGGETHAIDKQTGEQVWYNHDSGTCCVDMRYFDNHVWVVDKYLYAINFQTGKTDWKAKSPNDHLASWVGYDEAMIIDEDRRVFFAMDGLEVHCAKLPNI